MLGGRLALVLQGCSRLDLGRDEGQTLVEYALILAVIAIVVVGALTFMRGRMTSVFSTIGDAL
jgi:pilus assembly protein Flp/PilA